MNSTIYLDTAATGIVSPETLKAGKPYNDLLLTSPSAAFYSFLESEYPTLQTNLAKFMGVAEERLSLAPNFSYGFSMLLASVKPYKKEVLVLDSDYPSLLLPLQLQGFKVHKLPSTNGFSWSLEEIENAITKHNVNVFALSHVQYNTGFKADMAAISNVCRMHGVLLLVDATQSLGASDFQFDTSGIDVLIASNYKWMNAGFGSAVMCFKKGFLDQFKPAIAGYGSLVTHNGQMVYEPSASSYFPGHMSLQALLMLNHAVKEKLNMDMKAIENENMAMAQELVAALQGLPLELVGTAQMTNRSAIVVIKSTEQLHAHLLENGIRTTFRNNTSRISFHYTNKKEDVNILLNCLKNFR